MSAMQLIECARGIHERVITLDTHCDFRLSNFTAETNYTSDLNAQVTLPKMQTGGLDVAWFVVYTGQGEFTDEGYAAAHAQALKKFAAIHRLVSEYAPDQIELALTSDDVRRIAASGKKVAMIAIENAYPIGVDLGNNPTGIVAFRRNSFDTELHEGILDNTDPNQVVMSGNDDRFIVVELETKTRRLIDRPSYLDAVQDLQKQAGDEQPEYRNDSSVFISDTAAIEGACVIEPGAVIEDDVIVYDSVVLAGATICCGAVVTRSIIGRHALIERDAKILRMIEPSDRNLRGGRGRGQDGWRKSA